MTTIMAKDQAHKLVDKMPENSTWDDLIHEIYVRQIIEEGLADSKSGRTKDVREIREKYGLPE
jgi:DNA-binding transcriptional regulator YiaG